MIRKGFGKSLRPHLGYIIMVLRWESKEACAVDACTTLCTRRTRIFMHFVYKVLAKPWTAWSCHGIHFGKRLSKD